MQDIGENKVSMKQNASGFWYCTDITINCISIIDGIRLMQSAIEDVEKLLADKNKAGSNPATLIKKG